MTPPTITTRHNPVDADDCQQADVADEALYPLEESVNLLVNLLDSISSMFIVSIVALLYSRRSKNWLHMLVFTFIEQIKLKNLLKSIGTSTWMCCHPF